MDLRFSSEEEQFRAEVIHFLKEKLPADIAHKVRSGHELGRDDHLRWQKILAEKGWLASNWPREYGGTGWGAIKRHIFDEECALACAPRLVPFGLRMLAPVLLKFGSEEQKASVLPRILDSSDWWCQGYSEPGAGSDLASLKTRAVQEGDNYIVNGQKTWTTLGQYANRIFCLVRTSTEGKPQQGISFLMMDLDMAGVEVRPIRLLEGGYEVNEVFFTDVKVPLANRVGEENQGWTIAKYLLTHERTNIAGTGYSAQELQKLKQLASTIRRGGKPLNQDPLFAAELAEVEMDLEAMRITNLRVLQETADGAAPGSESSMLKIKGTQIRQRINALYRRALGPAAAPFSMAHAEADSLCIPPEAASAAAVYFNNRKLSIYGGSNEIQRTIVAKAVFGG